MGEFYEQLCLSERIYMQSQLELGFKAAAIAAALKREPSTISGELRRKDNRGRSWACNRACFEGILWILRTGSPWRFLPDKYPSPRTCWRRLKQWEEQDVWLDAWRALLGALDGEGLLQWDECFLDGSFAPAKRGRCSR